MNMDHQHTEAFFKRGIPLYYYDTRIDFDFANFGDMLSEKIIERIVGRKISVTFNTNFHHHRQGNKLLAIGSILHYAENYDVIWGSGIHGNHLSPDIYSLRYADIRAVRGPLTRQFLLNYGIPCPEVYGDPALLIPRLFPEFKRALNPSFEYIIIPHFSDTFFCMTDPQVVSVKWDWDKVIQRILDAQFVISSSLHGIIVAEAFGIPARYLRISEHEPLFKYKDYYFGTNHFDFKYATSVEEALEMGGEEPPQCDLDRLLNAFPYDKF
jgi:pyruvyltransferase